MHAVIIIVFFLSLVKRNLLGQKRSFWGVIECLERISSDFMESVQNTKSIVGIRYTLLHLTKLFTIIIVVIVIVVVVVVIIYIRTNVGKGRAWIRMSLMRKKLADYIRIVSENKSTL